MLNFTYENKCEIHFGKLPETHIAECIKKLGVKKVLIHYGSGSIIKTGLYEKIKNALVSAGLKTIEFGGVRANPTKSLALRGAEFARHEKVDFILAVGGGSVIDSAKCIAAGAKNKNIWDYYEGKRNQNDLKDILPVGVVLTIAAAGSECSPTSVIRNEETGIKHSINPESIRPKFAFINPEYCMTLPKNQIANGASDIFAHLFERFFADDSVKNAIFTDKLLTGAMHAMLEIAPKVYNDINNYDALANFCLIGTLAHNSMLNMGRGRGCWASHRIDNVLLSGVKDIAHGEGLAICIPAYLKFMKTKKPERVIQFEKEVITIKELEKFYKSIGLPITLRDINFDFTEIKALVRKAFPLDIKLGGYGQLSINEIEKIIEIAK